MPPRSRFSAELKGSTLLIGDELPFPATLGSFARLLEGLKPVAIEGWEVKERKNFVPSRVIPHSPGKNSRAS